MKSTERFSDRADNYAKYRPSYPTDAIDRILQGLNDPVVAADVGAGTGISSRALAAKGVRVYAIEPNAEMRQIASPDPLVEFYDGTAEKTNLADASVDLITCFQSFHWFDRKATIAEFRRILKTSGRLALVWNMYDVTDKFTESYNRIVYKAAFFNPLKHFYELRIAPSELGMRWYQWRLWRILQLYDFTSASRDRFAYGQELNLSELMGLTMSFSIVPLSGSANEQLISELKKLCDRYSNENGKVYFKYKTVVYLAR
jgi:SAM-dependent methyltransferase